MIKMTHSTDRYLGRAQLRTALAPSSLKPPRTVKRVGRVLVLNMDYYKGVWIRVGLLLTAMIIMVFLYTLKQKPFVLKPPEPAALSTYSVKLTRPLYMYSGTLFNSTAILNTIEEEEDIKTLACAKGGIAEKYFGVYGMCVSVLSNDTLDLLKEEKMWTLDDYNRPEPFLMADYKQRWYAGRIFQKDQLIAWYKISPEMEGYMAQNMHCMQKAERPVAPRARYTEYVFTTAPIPRCGLDTLQKVPNRTLHRWAKFIDFKSNWTMVFRWRKADGDLWRIFPTRPQMNILHVRPENGLQIVQSAEENPYLTELLPNEELSEYHTVPTLLY